MTGDGGPVAGARVLLAAEDSDPNGRPIMVTCGRDGSYRIAPVSPGKYMLAVVEEDVGLSAYGDLAEEGGVVRIEVHPKQKLVQDLKRRDPLR